MLDWMQPVFVSMFGHASETALAREVKAQADNRYADLAEKEIARVVIDCMAAAAAKKMSLGRAVVKQLARSRK